MNMEPSENEEHSIEKQQREFREDIRKKEERRKQSRESSRLSIWFGMGVFGLVGWSVAVPTLLGTGIGYWVDQTWPRGYSWTLMGLFAGIVLGCLNAWRWVSLEHSKIEGDNDHDLD